MPNEKAVSNTTPIITLSRIEHLWILKEMYGEIYVPQAVFDEIMVKNDQASEDIRNNSNWIIVNKVKNTKMKRLFSSSLHSGEVEAIMLADEINADIIIIDDFLAKKICCSGWTEFDRHNGNFVKGEEKRIDKSD